MKYRNLVVIAILAFASFAFADNDKGGSPGNNGGGNGGCGVGQTTDGCPTPTPTPAPTPGGTGSSSSSSSSTGGSVNGSGNSSNKNTNAQGQQQGQSSKNKNTNNVGSSSDSSASDNGNGNGNGANDTTITTNVAAPKIPVATAYAPAAIATVPCFKAYSGGGQASNFGFSIGGGKVDGTCQTLEVARSYAISGSRKAYCKMMVNLKQSKQAGITFDDCMYEEPAPQASSAAASMPPAKAQSTATVVVANPPSAEPVVNTVLVQRAASPEMGCDKADNICKARLDDSIMYLQHNPDSYIILTHGGDVANAAAAAQIQALLVKGGISRDRIKFADGTPKLGRVDITFGSL